MTDAIVTPPSILAKVETLRESLAKAAESENPVSFSQCLADLVRLLTSENQRLNETLRNEISVPQRRAVSISACEDRELGKDNPRATVFALDHVGDVWRMRSGADYWERLPSIPTPVEAERQAREREEAALERHRIAQERAFR